MELNKQNYLELRDSNKYTRPQMAGIFGVSDSKLKRWISSNNLGRVKPRLDNPRAFDNYSKEASYWAGFIAADGCVDESGRVRFYLALKDVNHLEKFAKFVGSTHKIRKDKERNRCSLEFVCKPMCKDLEKWNIYQNKTLTYEFPESTKYLSSFIRGLFDGDGCICERFSNINSKTSTITTTIVGSNTCIDSLCSILYNLGIVGSVKDKHTHKVASFSTLRSIKLLKYMYEDSTPNTRLERKYALYYKLVVQGIRQTR